MQKLLYSLLSSFVFMCILQSFESAQVPSTTVFEFWDRELWELVLRRKGTIGIPLVQRIRVCFER